ncbi:hypothetical protein [Bradyrhizobium sp. LTSPM299]|uniref:hypothetical protein n=1 Tax=Bradyrhizobium sp. LTSPM299 TaxID=1619233 RepID=UPI000B19E4BA|nr:hypothetical protein [Bradyrhizobium sp. LTSPM299]
MAQESSDSREHHDVFVVPAEHRAAVLEGLDQAKRGEFASDEEMAALWKRYGFSS